MAGVRKAFEKVRVEAKEFKNKVLKKDKKEKEDKTSFGEDSSYSKKEKKDKMKKEEKGVAKPTALNLEEMTPPPADTASKEVEWPAPGHVNLKPAASTSPISGHRVPPPVPERPPFQPLQEDLKAFDALRRIILQTDTLAQGNQVEFQPGEREALNIRLNALEKRLHDPNNQALLGAEIKSLKTDLKSIADRVKNKAATAAEAALSHLEEEKERVAKDAQELTDLAANAAFKKTPRKSSFSFFCCCRQKEKSDDDNEQLLSNKDGLSPRP